MTGGPARSLRLLVEPHQLVHQLIDAVAGLRGELLDGRILHRGDIGAEFVRAPRYRPGLAEQGRDHLRRRRIHLVPAVLGHDHDCAARRKPRLRGSGGGRSGVTGSVIETAARGRREVAGPGHHGHRVGVKVTSPASGCSSAAESVVLDDGTVQVVPEHPVRIH
jgi:hypothetical protein